MRPDNARAVERARQVDAEIALPELGHLVPQLAHVVERRSVVDEDVDRAHLVDHPCNGRLDLSVVRHVALDGGRAAAELLDLLRGLLRVDETLRLRHLGQRAVLGDVLRLVRLDLDVGDDHVGARLGEHEGVLAPEAARAAGDEGYSPREIDLERHVR